MSAFSRHFRWAAVVVFAAAFLLRLSSPSRDPKIAIAVFDESGGTLRDAARRFKKAHPEIEVQLREFTYDDLQKLLFRTSPNSTESVDDYDVVMVDHPWLAPLRQRERLTHLTIEEAEQMPPNVRDSVKCAPPLADPFCVIGIPYLGNSEIFVMNQRLLPGAKWPAQWDDVVSLASHLTGTEAYAYAPRGSSDNSSVTDEFMPVYWWALGLGGVQGTAAAGRAAGILASLAGKSPPSFGLYGSYEVSALLLYGKVAMGITWSDWAMKMATVDSPTVKDLKFGPIPGDAPELGMWALAIPVHSKHSREAKRFIQFATTRDELEQAALAGNPPARIDLLRSTKLAAKYPSFPAQLDSLENARGRPGTEGWHDCSERRIAEALRDLYFGRVAADVAAHRIQAGLTDCN